ncbi:MAG: cation-translocating P-type ATPase [Methanomicrobiales archaeon]|nr:cation-translocating P-type ATPase [Methanomicrobiales archaeon]
MTPPIDIDTLEGLTSEEVARRHEREGYNELPQAEKRNTLSILLEVFREPMFLLLVGAGSIYFFLGDIQEGLMLLFFVFVIIGITVYQERKTENALQALQNLSSPRALVIRDHTRQRIPGREVVRGDLILLSEGDRVPADARILDSKNLLVDESILTGESVPVRKFPGEVGGYSQPGGEDQPQVYSGTLVVQGRGLAEVTAIGRNTEIGKIGRTLSEVGVDETPLEKETRWIVRNIAAIGLGLFLITVVVYGVTRFDWIGGLLAGITLAMAILPEEFPVVLTVFLALGAWRISQNRVLTRRVTAIEALGSATVLCVDKTGTLTENRMRVVELMAKGERCDVSALQDPSLPEFCHELVEYAILASKRDPFDPMERALVSLGQDGLAGTEHLHARWELVEEYPLSRELLAMSNVWRSPDGQEYVIAAKGAPEAIGDLCHLSKAELEELSRQVQSLAGDGLRVLGVAKSSFRIGELPTGQHEFPFAFLGLIGFLDPVRPGVPDAIAECQSAGVRVIMITGDYPATAMKIASQIGLGTQRDCLTGPDVEILPPQEFRERINRVSVIARAVPEQKLAIVSSLKETGNTVAMTGDGVNDAPALKEADIGIAMGARGTDVAREAASLVLLDDAFSSIVAAIRMGRRIFDNLRRAMAYIIAVHVPIAGMSLLPIIFGWPLVLLPVHVVFLELIIDPACSIVFEAEEAEPDLMQRPPRARGESILNRSSVLLALVQGGVVLLALLLVFSLLTTRGLDVDEARAFTFTSIVIANLGLIAVNRSWSSTLVSTFKRPNRALWVVIAAAVFFLGLVLTIPALRALFQFAPLDGMEMASAIAVGIASVFWFEIFKRVRRRRAAR